MVITSRHRMTSVAAALSFFFSSRRRHTRFDCDWSSDVCSSDLEPLHDRADGLFAVAVEAAPPRGRDLLHGRLAESLFPGHRYPGGQHARCCWNADRKSTRLNSSHSQISYAVFCLKKKNHHMSATYVPFLHFNGFLILCMTCRALRQTLFALRDIITPHFLCICHLFRAA